jgi:hydrogenase maturation protease
MEKNILILCTGYPFTTDTGFGFLVSKVLQKMQLPENVEFLEVGESASEFPHIIEGKDKLIIIDVFQTKGKPGTIVRLKPEEVPVTVDGVTDVAKFHLMETLEQIKLSGKFPETIFLGVIPKDTKTEHAQPQLSPEVESKIPEVIDLIMKEISQGSHRP